MPFTDERVLVIGGSSGMGLATARAVRAAGGSVVIASTGGARLARAAADLGGDVETARLDIGDAQAVATFFRELGALDHLVITASRGYMGPFAELDVSAAKAAFDVGFWGRLVSAQQAAPQIRPGGSIVLFAGISSRRPPARGGAIPASMNAAIEGLGRALALELAPIRVNTISPGVVDTPLWASMPEAERTEFYRGAAATLPVGRVGLASDAATAALFLMRNGFVTGATIDLDGGRLIS